MTVTTAALKTFTLSNNVKIPSISAGFGTKWASRHRPNQKDDELDDSVIQGIKDAIAVGITHIDGAENYGTEGEIGEAIIQSGVKREDLFITTKVHKNLSDPIQALQTSLAKLKTDYVDLYLIHSPFYEDLEGAWKALETLHKQGKARSIGVSNFKVEHLEKILKIAEIKPVVNQIEFHPYLQNQSPGIVEFSQKHGILIEAYSPLGPIKEKGGPLDPLLEELAKKYSKTTAQIIIRWTLQRGVLPVTASAKVQRLKEANDVFDFELTSEEVAKISQIGETHEKRFFWTGGQFP